MQQVLLGAFIQLGIHMVDTGSEGIRVKIKGGVTLYTMYNLIK